MNRHPNQPCRLPKHRMISENQPVGRCDRGVLAASSSWPSLPASWSAWYWPRRWRGWCLFMARDAGCNRCGRRWPANFFPQRHFNDALLNPTCSTYQPRATGRKPARLTTTRWGSEAARCRWNGHPARRACFAWEDRQRTAGASKRPTRPTRPGCGNCSRRGCPRGGRASR